MRNASIWMKDIAVNVRKIFLMFHLPQHSEVEHVSESLTSKGYSLFLFKYFKCN